jgi:hypothetical protein
VAWLAPERFHAVPFLSSIVRSAIALAAVAAAGCMSDSAGDAAGSGRDSGLPDGGAGCCFLSCVTPTDTSYQTFSGAVDGQSCASAAVSLCKNSNVGTTEFIPYCDCQADCYPSWFQN